MGCVLNKFYKAAAIVLLIALTAIVIDRVEYKRTASSTDTKTFREVGRHVTPTDIVLEVCDECTGVHYFISSKGGMTPRYNANGTLYKSTVYTSIHR